MQALFVKLAAALERRARYRRTVAELRAMPLDVALDLDIDRAAAPRIARRAVYGV